MAPKIPTVKVRVLRSFYYLDLLPDDTWSRAATYKSAGQIIPMKLMDAIENKTTKKVEFVKEEPAPAPPVVAPAATEAKAGKDASTAKNAKSTER